ncbi:MAG: putative spermine/spermidine synthase protein [Phenylobacterium sp.]|nr:putative spermine/spermidine synthase protein [Phenylobacterium sp.]
MTSSSVASRAAGSPAPALFAATVFASAALVFLVEPMAARLVLPQLGGSPSVWNTSLAFFQAALLAGYGYAHLLQRLRRIEAQAAVHVLVLLAAGAVLPLRLQHPFGPPSSDHPILWLLGVLAVSIGPPFAALSATAPLVQAWQARVFAGREGREPYVLYAASNLGSLLALLAYPLVVEPALTLGAQTEGWSAGYAVFLVAVAVLAVTALRTVEAAPALPHARTARPAWGERLRWMALAALPSSLMLGVTSYITTDVASAPFLWVLPLALYLASFVAAFAAKPPIAPGVTLVLQAALAAACAAMLPFSDLPFLAQLAVHLSAFFFTALMCHQALVASRPPPDELTGFYLWISAGGVLGGAFNAFVAPAIFDNVWEYPLVLTLAALARPWGRGRTRAEAWVMLGLAAAAAVAATVIVTFRNRFPGGGVVGDLDLFQLVVIALLAAGAIAAFRLRGDGLMFCAALAALSLGAAGAAERATTVGTWRSFFGVLRISEANAPALGGRVRLLSHGTTLHGAEALSPAFRCRPLVYYTPLTPIGQVFRALEAAHPALRIGTVGLGTGSVAAYVRAADHLTFFEIDPLVVRIARRQFAYTTQCAAGPVDYVLGDARLTLARQPRDAFDLLLIDAFSSDAVPTHLLTVEAVRGYLGHLKPGGVLILHLSNRNLELDGPAQAVAHAAGGAALVQQHRVKPGRGAGWESDEDAVIVGRSPAALAAFAADPRWRADDPGQARAWTDDYVNLPGALWRKLRQRYGGAPRAGPPPPPRPGP